MILIDSFQDELNFLTIQPGQNGTFARNELIYGAMADSKVHSDGGIVFYALEIV